MSVPPSPGHPHGFDYIKQLNESFCNAVQVGLVAELATRHNDQKKCRISLAPESGCTFTSYKVTFPDDGKEWIVRIAIPSGLGNEWDTIRNEAATIKYIQRHTSIRVPTVHAFGTDERLTSNPSTTQSWIITDRLPGKPVSTDDLLLMTREKRQRFFSELGDVLAQLQELKFPNTGSLYPDKSDDTKQQVGPSLNRQDRILALRDGRVRSRPTFTTTWDCIEHHLMAMRGMPDMRSISRSNDIRDDIARQILAMDAVNRHVRDESRPPFWREDAGFSLSHGNLENNRIFVDDGGNIQGIIHWAFAEILPRQLCHPPNFVLGTYSNTAHRQYNPIWDEFQEAIPAKHKYYKHLQYYLDNETQLGFASILRSPSDLMFVYFWDKFYYSQHQQAPGRLLVEFFSKPENKAELERRLADQKLHSDDIVIRQASAIVPRIQAIRDWFIEVQDLVINVSKAGHYKHEPFSNSPALSANSGSSPVPSQRSASLGDGGSAA